MTYEPSNAANNNTPVDERRVLFSDFDLWHFVLNYWYLPASEEDDQAFEARMRTRSFDFYTQKPLPDPAFHAQKASSDFSTKGAPQMLAISRG